MGVAVLLSAINDDPSCRIVRRQSHSDFVAQDDANAVFPQFATEVREHLVTGFQFDPETARGQHFDHTSLKLNMLFAGHLGG